MSNVNHLVQAYQIMLTILQTCNFSNKPVTIDACECIDSEKHIILAYF